MPLNYCSECGSELQFKDKRDDGLILLECPACGEDFFTLSTGKYETKIVENLMNSPLEVVEDVSKFFEDSRQAARETAEKIESNLENSIMDKEQELSFRFFAKQPGRIENAFYEQEKELIVNSLTLYEGENFEIRNKLGEELNFLEKYRIDFGRKDRTILIDIYKSLPQNEKEAKKKIHNTEQGAYYSSKRKSIVLKKISTAITEKTETIPDVLRPLLEQIRCEGDQFEAILCHELTHAWLHHESPAYPNQKEELEAINEIFAYFISWHFTGKKFSNDESDLYARPDLIKWGLTLLIQKVEEFEKRGLERNRIDFGRDVQLKTYNAAHDRGENKFTVFLNLCLYESDKRKLQKLRKIDEFLQEDFNHLKSFLIKKRTKVTDKEKFERITNILREVDWENPEKMKEHMLADIKEDSINGKEYYGLDEVSFEINSKIENEITKLEKLLRALNDLENFINKDKNKKLLNFQKDIENVREELASLTN